MLKMHVCFNERDEENRLIVRDIQDSRIVARLTDEEAAALFTEKITA